MSRVTALKFTTRGFSVVTLEGTRTTPTCVTNKALLYPTSHDTSRLMDWCETQFNLLIDQEIPDRVAYKLVTSLSAHDQIFHVYYALGVLHLVCHKKELEIQHVTPSSLSARCFGLQQGTDMDSYIASLFTGRPSPWNSEIRETALIALSRLGR